jgi:hypothetical protein
VPADTQPTTTTPVPVIPSVNIPAPIKPSVTALWTINNQRTTRDLGIQMILEIESTSFQSAKRLMNKISQRLSQADSGEINIEKYH